jgi:hypothetical protein
MPWLVAVFVVLLVAALARSMIINARALARDVNTRFDRFRARLERDANSLLDDFLEASQPPDPTNGGGPDRA